MNETSPYTMSSSFENQTASVNETQISKRKFRRVRSLIKSSVSKYSNSKTMNQTIIGDGSQSSVASQLNDKRPYPFGQCRVCMDKATGAHYGVPTCEGCKGFFKRSSILRKEKYRCYFGDACVINTDNRNRCKACRFKKCLQEGMSVEGVRMGRIPKLVKEKALAEHQPSSDESTLSLQSSSSPRISLNNSSSTNFLLNDFDLSLIAEQCFPVESNSFTMSESDQSLTDTGQFRQIFGYPFHSVHDFEPISVAQMKEFDSKIIHPTLPVDLNDEEYQFLQYLKQKVFDLSLTYNQRTKQLVERMNRMTDLEIEHFPGDQSSLQDIWIGLTDAIPYHVKNLIAFAREIPGVNELDPKDFQKIINNRLFDFWMIKHAPLIRHDQSYIMLPNGLQYTRRWMSEIIGQETVQAMFQFANQLNSLSLTQDEYALIFPIIICSPDQTLNDPETVQQLHNCFSYLLFSQMLTIRAEFEARDLFRRLIQVFNSLPLLNELEETRIVPLIPKCQ